MTRITFDQFLGDVRTALRNMSRYPLACAVAVISLAAGIGCTTATLTIRNAVFYNPPPLVESPQELSIAGMATAEQTQRRGVPRDVFFSWREETSVVAAIAAQTTVAPRNLRSGSTVESVRVQAVTPDMFTLLGVQPVAGRSFTAGDMRPDGGMAAILSFQAWERIFGRESAVIGTVVWLDERPYTIVGVMPQRFRSHRGIWIPLDVSSTGESDDLDVIIRRQPGISEAVLAAALQDRLRVHLNAGTSARVQLAQLRGTPLGEQISPPVVWLLGACVVLTLLIACTNVAVLMIAQWTAREREIAIRASLGASRGRIVRSLLAESTLLAVFGGVIGLAATFALVGLMISRGPEDLPFYNLAIDTGILARTIAITFAVGILAGLGPALYETRRLQTNPLCLIATDRVRHRWRNALVVFEITVTIALLVVTASMVDGYKRMLSWNFGFDAGRLYAVTVPAAADVTVSDIRNTLNRLPGVRSVAEATAIPIFATGERQAVGTQPGTAGLAAYRSFIGADFFQTLGVPIRRGRPFQLQETQSEGARIVVVNETLASRLWPGEDPIGKVMWNEAVGYDVIGVAAEYTENPLGRPRPNFYLPLSERPENTGIPLFLVETTEASAPVVRAARIELEKLDRGITVRSLQSMVEAGASELAVTLYPMTPLLATGILLTAAGIYGILAFAITRRSKELAVRIAIGARNSDLLRLIAALAVRLVATGILLGIGLTFGLSRLIQGVGGVFDSPRWPVFAVPALIILAVAVIASWVPSRRAIALDPVVLLRSE